MPAASTIRVPLPTPIDEEEISEALTTSDRIQAILDKVSRETGSTLIQRDDLTEEKESDEAVEGGHR